jgi:hypothetical protein
MIDTHNNEIIFCPYCKIPITVEELGEHVNANPETKQEAIEEQMQLSLTKAKTASILINYLRIVSLTLNALYLSASSRIDNP